MDITNAQPISHSPRYQYIDTARGIGLILLVLGHIVTGNTRLFNWIYSFHMPLFFYLSGLCVKEERLTKLKPYFIQKLKQRILPYFSITLFGIFICMLIPPYRHLIFEDGILLHMEHIFLRMIPKNLYVGQVWFLASLFCAEIYFYCWYKLCYKNLLLQFTGILCLIFAARYIWKIFIYIPVIEELPFQMDTAFMGAFCYILGFLTNKNQFLKKTKKYTWLLLLPLLFLNLFFGTYKNGYVNMCDLVFGNMWYYLIAMVSGIFTITLISYNIPKTALLSWYGRHSLPLFAVHTFLIYLVREFVHIITGNYYTMMVDVPPSTVWIITFIVLLLFLPIGKIYNILLKKFF